MVGLIVANNSIRPLIRLRHRRLGDFRRLIVCNHMDGCTLTPTMGFSPAPGGGARATYAGALHRLGLIIGVRAPDTLMVRGRVAVTVRAIAYWSIS